MPDEVDDIIIPSLGKYKECELKAANRAGSDKELNTEEETKAAEKKEKDFKPVLEKIKEVLGDKVKEVRFSKRLSDSPSCIVVDETDPSLQMERMMRAMGQFNTSAVKPILEVNADHPLVQKLKDSEDKEFVEDMSNLLLEQALLVESGELKAPVDFVKRLNRLMTNLK